MSDVYRLGSIFIDLVVLIEDLNNILNRYAMVLTECLKTRETLEFSWNLFFHLKNLECLCSLNIKICGFNSYNLPNYLKNILLV